MSAGTSQHTNDSGEFDFGKMSKSSPTVINEQSFMERLAKLQEITIREEFVLECNRLIDYLGKNSDLSPSILNRAFNDLRQTIRILHTITGDVHGLEQSESKFIKIFLRDVKTDQDAHQYNAFLHLSEAYCNVLAEPLNQARLDLIRAEISLEIGDPEVSEEMFISALRGMRDQNNEYLASHREEAMQYLIRFGEVNYFLGRYKDAVQNYESALDLSTTHEIPIAENDAGIVMSHYAFAYAMQMADNGDYRSVFEQSPPYVTLSPDTKIEDNTDREMACRRIGKKFLTLSCIGIANAVLDQGQDVQFGLEVINDVELGPLDVAIRVKAVQLRLSIEGHDCGKTLDTNEVIGMLNILSKNPYSKETLPDTEVEVYSAILKLRLIELSKLIDNSDTDNLTENDKTELARAYNISKQLFEELYNTSIRASGFDYSFQVLKMYSELRFEFRRIPNSVIDEYSIELPCYDRNSSHDIGILAKILPEDIIQPVSRKLFF